MRSRNKIISGYMKEFKFIKRYGKLYLKCLEKEYAINKMTVSSFQVIDCKEQPAITSILARGYILSKILGILGLISGVATAKKNCIYRVKISFVDGGVGLAEVNAKIYDMLVAELFDL